MGRGRRGAGWLPACFAGRPTVCSVSPLRWIGIGPGRADCAESIPGPSTDYFGELAKKHELYVFLAALDGSEARKVSTIDSRVEYADGHLFFGRKGNLFAQPFDERRLKLSGEPFRVAENLGLSGAMSAT